MIWPDIRWDIWFFVTSDIGPIHHFQLTIPAKEPASCRSVILSSYQHSASRNIDSHQQLGNRKVLKSTMENDPYMNSTHNRSVNTLRPRQNGCHFADNIFEFIFFQKLFCFASNFIEIYLQGSSWQNSSTDLAAKQMTNHYLNAWWSQFTVYIWLTQPQWIITLSDTWAKMTSICKVYFLSIFLNDSYGILLQILVKFVTLVAISTETTILLSYLS